METDKRDTEILLNYCMNMAKGLLVEMKGEFYPIGCVIDNDGMAEFLNLDDDDEFPLSDRVIKDFKVLFDGLLANQSIRAYAVAYDTRVTNKSYPESTDAVAIFVKHNEKEPIIYYYPYSLKDDKPEVYKPWANMAD